MNVWEALPICQRDIRRQWRPPWRIFIGLCLLSVLPYVKGTCTPCPGSCSCNINSDGMCDVDCRNAGLTQFPLETDLPQASTIATIDFCDNQLTDLSAGVFENLTSVTEIFLSGNQLSSLPINVFQNLTKLTTVNLLNNQWHCDCNLLWLKSWIRNRDLLSNFSVVSISQILCSSPSYVAGFAVVDLDDDFFTCAKPTHKIRTKRQSWKNLNRYISCALNQQNITEVFLFSLIIKDKSSTKDECNTYCVNKGQSHMTLADNQFCICATVDVSSTCTSCPDLNSNSEPADNSQLCGKDYIGRLEPTNPKIIMVIGKIGMVSVQALEDVEISVASVLTSVSNYYWNFGDSDFVFQNNDFTATYRYMNRGQYMLSVTLESASTNYTKTENINVIQKFNATALVCPSYAKSTENLEVKLTIDQGSSIEITWSDGARMEKVGPVDVPYFVTGTVVFEGSLSPVLPLAVAAGQPVNLPKTLHILPGMWFQYTGQLKSWEFIVEGVSTLTRLHLQIFKPSCVTGTLVPPGCVSAFAECVSGVVVPSCAGDSPVNCSYQQQYCPLSKTCIPIQEPCNCNTVNNSNCPAMSYQPVFINTLPVYSLVGETVAEINKNGVFEISAGGLVVDVNYVIGFQHDYSVNVIKCDTSSSIWKQTVLKKPTIQWVTTSGSAVDFSGVSPYIHQQVCAIRAIYSPDHTVSLPAAMADASNLHPGTTNIVALVLNVLSNKMLSCDIEIQEPIESLRLIRPAIHVMGITAGSNGTLIIANRNPVEFLIHVSSGNNLTTLWNPQRFITHFVSVCPVTLSALPECSASGPSDSYSSASLMFANSSVLEIHVQNDVSSAKLVFDIQVQFPVKNVTLVRIRSGALCVGVEESFEAVIDGGSELQINWSVNGTMLVHNTTVLNHTFALEGFYEIQVNVSNMVSSAHAEYIYMVIKTAKPRNMKFTTAPQNYTTSNIVSFEAMVEVTLGTPFRVLWDFGDGNDVSYDTSASGSTMTFQENHNFTIPGQFTVNLTVFDSFDSVSITHSILIKNKITMLVFKASKSSLAVGEVVSFYAQPIGDSDVVFLYNYGAGLPVLTTNRTTTSKSFSTAGQYNITLTADNIVSSADAYLLLTVDEYIKDLTLSSDGPKMQGLPITVKASLTSGTNVLYSFSFDSNIPDVTANIPSYTYLYNSSGSYNVTVNASNPVSVVLKTIKVYVMDHNTLEVLEIESPDCSTVGEEVNLTVAVVHHRPNVLEYQWDFGDGFTENRTGLQSVLHNFTSANMHIIQLRVHSNVSNDSTVGYVCVQEFIQSVTLANKGPYGLTRGGIATAELEIDVTGGSNYSFLWSYGSITIREPAVKSYDINLTSAGEHIVNLTVFNQVSSVNVSTIVTVKEYITGMVVHHNAPTDFITMHKSYTYTASIMTGTDVKYKWNFNDVLPVKYLHGQSRTYAYTIPGRFKAEVTASNGVSTHKAHVYVTVQENVEDLSLSVNATDIAVGGGVAVTATLRKGTPVNYKWSFCETCNDVFQSLPTSAYSYSTSGEFIISVEAFNNVSSTNANISVYVIEAIGNLSIDGNLTQNKFAEKGKQLDFCKHLDSSDVRMFHTWLVYKDGVQMTDFKGQILKYTFNDVGEYEVYLRVSNPLGSKSVSLNVQVIETITGLQINTSSLASKVNDVINFQAEYTTGTNLSYKWTVEKIGSSSRDIIATDTDQVSHNFTTTGDYYITLSVSNVLSSRSEVLKVVIQDPVTAVKINGGNTWPYVEVGTISHLNIHVDGGTDLNYLIELFDKLPTKVFHTQSTSYLFDKIGKTDVFVSVWNLISRVNQTVEVAVQETIADLNVTASSLTPYTGQIVDFTAYLSAGSDVYYAWNFGDASVLTTNYNASGVHHVFKSTGSFIVTLQASNNISLEVRNLTVYVQEKIQNLQIWNCCADILPAQEMLTFEGGSSHGSDVQFRWTFSVRNQHPKVLLGKVVQTSFSDPGTVDIKLEAWNNVSFKSIIGEIILEVPIKNLQLIPLDPLQTVFVNDSLHFLASVGQGSNIFYTWTLLKTLDTLSNSLSFNKTFYNPGNYTLQIVAFNNVTVLKKVVEFEIIPILCDPPVLDLLGSIQVTRYKSKSLYLAVDVDLQGCKAYELIYKWKFYQAPSCIGITVHMNAFVFPSIVDMSRSSIQIPKGSLDYGKYCVVFTANYKGTPMTSSISVDLTIKASAPIAIIMGGTELEVSAVEEYVIDGTLSYHPDYAFGAQPTMQYKWTCTEVSNQGLAQFPGSVGCFSGTRTTSTVTIPPNTLQPGNTYVFTLTVSYSGHRDVMNQTVFASSFLIPLASIECFSCRVTGHNRISGADHVAMRGSCSNCVSDEEVAFAWSVTTENGTDIPLDDSTTTTGANKPNLVVKKGALADSGTQAHIFKLRLKNSRNISSYASLALPPNLPPKLVQGATGCQVNPTSVVALTDKVTVECVGFVDPEGSSLEYSIYIERYLSQSDSTDRYRLYKGGSNRQDLYLASWPDEVHKLSKDVHVVVYISDIEGAYVVGANSTVTVKDPVRRNMTAMEHLLHKAINDLPNFVRFGQTEFLRQQTIALTMQLNWEAELAKQRGDTRETNVRSEARKALVMAVSNLPLNSLQDAQDVASTLESLTSYLDEFQSRDSQRRVIKILDQLQTLLQTVVTQGVDGQDFALPALISTISQIIEAANLGFYQPGLSSTISKSTNLNVFGSSGSNALVNTGGYTDKQHRQYVVGTALKHTGNLMSTVLKTQLLNEKEIHLRVAGMEVLGQRTTAQNLWHVKSSNGVAFVIPDGLFKYLDPYEEIFEIMFVIPNNPYTWGYIQNYNISSPVPDLAFKFANGTDIPVQKLLPHQRFKILMLPSGNASVPVDAGKVVGTADYDPHKGLKYYTTTIHASSGKKVNLNTTVADGETGIHIQVGFTVLPNTSAPRGSELEVYLDIYLGKNYEATEEEYERKLKIQVQHMISGVDHRTYTLFLRPSEFDHKATYSLTINNRGFQHSVHVSVGVYSSSCQFYNDKTSAWDIEGCEPDGESIATRTVCLCNHLTSFGASTLLPPNAIDFEDITKLDLADNPVAVITLSVVAAVYILSVIVARRKDLHDLHKISTVPLCGKNGSFIYEVIVYTGRQRGAGTTAHVGIKVYGEIAKSQAKHLTKTEAFQRSSIDSFLIASDVNLGNLYKVRIWHDNTGRSPSWFLTKITVRDLQTNRRYSFLLDTWLSLEVDNGEIEKVAMAADMEDLTKFSRVFGSETSRGFSERHVWLSVFERPAQSRFTCVQRTTCCVTLLYTYMCVNMMWYGVFKTKSDFTPLFSWQYFSWEEIIVGALSSLMVFPVNLVLMQLFANSKYKVTVLDQKPQTAQTVEMEAMCDLVSYDERSYGRNNYIPDILKIGDREGSADSLPVKSRHLHRTENVWHSQCDAEDEDLKETDSCASSYMQNAREDVTDRSMYNTDRMWASYDSILNWPDRLPGMRDDDSINSQSYSASFRGRQMATLERVKEEPESEIESPNTSPARKKSNTLPSPDVIDVNQNIPERTPDVQHTFNPRREAELGDTVRPPAPTPGMIHRKSWDQITWPVRKENTFDTIDSAQPDVGFHRGNSLSGKNSWNRRLGTPIFVPPNTPRRRLLPHWCTYITYILCFALSSVSILMVILYGHKLGRERALKWLIAFILSFLESAFIIEPLKIVLVALCMATITKHYGDDDDRPDIEPEVEANEQIKGVHMKPIGGYALLQAREEALKIKRMHLIIRQFFAYVFLIWLVLTINYADRDGAAYHMTNGIETSLVKGMRNAHGNATSFLEISSHEAYWHWLQHNLLPHLYNNQLHTSGYHGYLVGQPRLLQIRNTFGMCVGYQSFPPLHGLGFPMHGCYGDGSWDEDTLNYQVGWNGPAANNTGWVYTHADQIKRFPIYGLISTYTGGAYIQYLPKSGNRSAELIEELKRNLWIDKWTRALVLDFTLYNANVGLYSVVSLTLEITLTGGMVASHSVKTTKFLQYSAEKIDPLIVIQGILGAAVIYFVIHILVSIKKQGCAYFKSFWNWFELATSSLAGTSCILYVLILLHNNEVFSVANSSAYIDYHSAVQFQEVREVVNAVLLFCLCLRVVRQMRFIRRMSLFGKTISAMTSHLIGCFLILIFVVVAYASLGYLMYGVSVHGYRSFLSSILTTVTMLRNPINTQPLSELHSIWTPVLFISYFMVVYMLVGGLVIAVILNTYKLLKSQMFYYNTLETQDYEMVEFMLKRFRLWTGLSKPKPAFRSVKFKGMPSLSYRSSNSSQSSRPTSMESRSTGSWDSWGFDREGSDVSRASLDVLDRAWDTMVVKFDEILYLEEDEHDLDRMIIKQMITNTQINQDPFHINPKSASSSSQSERWLSRRQTSDLSHKSAQSNRSRFSTDSSSSSASRYRPNMKRQDSFGRRSDSGSRRQSRNQQDSSKYLDSSSIETNSLQSNALFKRNPLFDFRRELRPGSNERVPSGLRRVSMTPPVSMTPTGTMQRGKRRPHSDQGLRQKITLEKQSTSLSSHAKTAW